ncbi:hypothetical protein [Pseudophaeobacter sp. TrK17]|uniref:hypothetical protein n=1 Tax=Pseudophaeobacter sp. TrK17 TaxID=2815167 RepID=UPI0035D04DF4
MAAETRELRLKINAAAAKSRAKEFNGAIKFITAAVQELDRAADGAFTKLDTSPKLDVSGIKKAMREVKNTAKATARSKIF